MDLLDREMSMWGASYLPFLVPLGAVSDVILMAGGNDAGSLDHGVPLGGWSWKAGFLPLEFYVKA